MKQEGVFFIQLYRDDIGIFAQNPMLKEFKPFDELEKLGEQGEKVMSAIFRIYDVKSPYYSVDASEKDRIEDVNKNYLEDEDFDWKEWDEYIKVYKEICRTPIQQKLDLLIEDINGREGFFRSISWDDEELRIERDLMTSNHHTFLKNYNDLVKEVNEELEEQLSLGDYRKSWLEQLAKDTEQIN